ncbi:MAG: alpha/beta hydrolase [Bacillota bacterium]
MRCEFHSLHLKEINRTVEITVCVPESTKTQRFPVLYMHDGQNIVDPKRSYSGSTWKIKESFESLRDMPEVVVVGISSAADSRRLDEYNPFEFEFETDRLTMEGGKTPGGLGEAYMQDIITQIKPFVDERYPTDPSAKNTAIMGSSLGGLISLYAGIAHGDYFTRVASLSGAFFVSMESLNELIDKSHLSHLEKVYIDTGDSEVAGGEPRDYLLSNQAVHADLKKKLDKDKLQYKEIKNGKHHETDWAKRFPEVIRFLFNQD